MRMLRYLCVLMAFAFPVTAQAQSVFQTSAQQAILVDFETGAVLFEKNANAQMPTSSMSKVMTMYMVFDALKNGTISLDDTFLVSEKAWRKGGSKMFVEVDKRIKVEDLIRGVIVQSGNDATIVLAEGLAGTEDAFAKAMTRKAKELGMENSNFTNASGWPDDNHYSTAEDLATLGVSIIRNFPEYYEYYSQTEYTYNDITQKNRNPLLYRNMGADGIKTGHTEAGGYGLIGSGKDESRRVVLVINGLEDARARAQESAKLLEYGLRSFKNVTLVKDGQIVTALPVKMGKSDMINVGVQEDIRVTMPALNGEDIVMNVQYNGPLVAPVHKGQEIGTLEIKIPGQSAVIETQLVAMEDVGSLGFFSRTLEKIRHFLGGASA